MTVASTRNVNFGETGLALLDRTQGDSPRHALQLDRLAPRQLCNHVRKHLQASSSYCKCIALQIDTELHFSPQSLISTRTCSKKTQTCCIHAKSKADLTTCQISPPLEVRPGLAC